MRLTEQRVREDGASTDLPGYSRAKQIIVQVLISARRGTEKRERVWTKAGTAYVGRHTQEAVEIESALSFPSVKTIAAVAEI